MKRLWILALLPAVYVAGAAVGTGSAAPATTTSVITVPAYCQPAAGAQFAQRVYPLNIPAADTYARSGEHGHGKLRCILFTTPHYAKWLLVDQSAGGYTITQNGLDVTYVDCSLPGYRFPPNKIDNGPNDCAESWDTSESNWVFRMGAFTGQQMFPKETP